MHTSHLMEHTPRVRQITVALDGSPLAERALPRATYLAQRSGAALLLVRVVKPWIPPDRLPPGIEPADLSPEADVAEAAAYLSAQAAAAAALAPGVAVQTAVRIGDPATELLAAVRETHGLNLGGGGSLLVLTTHGRSGLARALWGSVADQVVRHAPVPVLLLPSGCSAAWSEAGPEGRRVLVPLDGSPVAEQVLAPAQGLAALLDAALLLVRIVSPVPVEYAVARAVAGVVEPEEHLTEAEQYLTAVTQRLQARGLRVETHAALGTPVAAIVHAAAISSADVIAMATHGRGGAVRMALGSVATGVLQRAAVPLLLLGPAARRRPAPPAGEGESAAR